MKAVRFVNPEGETQIGALDDDGTITDAGAAGPQGFVPTTLAWDALRQADGPTYGVGDVRLLHPVVPGKLIGIGLNYRSHAEESQLDIPSVPVIFAKFSSSLIGPGAEIVIPREETRPDYEGELAVVIGQGVYRADADEARAAVGGIAAINDVSGRRAQLETPLRQFTLGKSFDTFSPLGPCIAPADGVDLADIDLRTTVSGEVMQDANTRDLIFSVVELIQYISAGATLEPGDVIATGTPSGVGDSRSPKRYLRQGDTVDIYIEGVGTLSNPVRNER
ncbi:MAG TPA: fumarylacetoacetate hydrolase family protein [Solirubrobacteraceae bacterium]|nr:fumarylacetoacetate hydrolase family protein [Solirubrobacteraceae bacterium]